MSLKKSLKEILAWKTENYFLSNTTYNIYIYIYIYIFNEFHSFLSNTTYNRSTYSIPIELTNFYKTWAHYWYTTNNLSHQQVSNFCISRVSPLSLNEIFFFLYFLTSMHWVWILWTKFLPSPQKLIWNIFEQSDCTNYWKQLLKL